MTRLRTLQPEAQMLCHVSDHVRMALGDPAKGIQDWRDTIFPAIENYLTLLYALVAALVVWALHARLKEQAPNAINFATGFGLFTAGLNVVEGVTGFFGQAAVLGLHAIFAVFLPPLSLPVLHIVWAFGLGLLLLRSQQL